MTTAQHILTKAAGHIAQRAASRDLPDGERSMDRTVAALLSFARCGWMTRQSGPN